MSLGNTYFNPRSRKGSDPNGTATAVPAWVISIHAPARGATFLADSPPVDLFLFQSTLPQGERRTCFASTPARITFQSTLPQGERPMQVLEENNVEEFQSTLPQGERRVKEG